MLRYIGWRLASTVPVILVVVVIVFSLLHVAPGDPALLIAGDSATPAQVEAIRANLGLDRPLPIQFLVWLESLAHLDLGRSAFSDRPVSLLIGQRLEPTIVLAVTTTLLATVLAVPLGVLAARRARSVIDRAVILVSVAGFSIPVFVIGYSLIYVFALKLRWFPVQGYKPLGAGLFACLNSILLPSFALALLLVGLLARVTRAAMLEILDEDYIRTARAKGARTARILIIHALKNAGPPIMTAIGIGFAGLLGGVVVTESVFNIPGIGRLTTDAILQRDYPVVQGVMLTFSMMLIGVNLAVDLTYRLFDPRVRY